MRKIEKESFHQEYLSGFHKDPRVRTCTLWCNLQLFRLLTNLVVLVLLAGCAYLLGFISVTQTTSRDKLIGQMVLPLCVSAINFILPFGFSIIASFEAYRKPQTELFVTMLRTIVLNLVTLGVLVYVWFNSLDCSQRDDGHEWLHDHMECSPCWETFLGMEIYKLIIMDFIFILLVTFFSEFIRKIMARFCCQSLGYAEFNIARNTLNLIYSQALVWLGTFYSPLLSCIMIFKLFIIFYVKRASVIQNCIPSVKPWRAGRTHTVIMALLFLAFLFCFGAQAYSVFFMKPSQVCGLYIGKNSSFDIITELVDTWNTSGNNFPNVLLDMVTSVAFLAFIIIALCVIAHYSRVRSKGYKGMVVRLKHQIMLEGKDKMFLLKLLREASKMGGSLHSAGSLGYLLSHSAGATTSTRRKTLEPRSDSPHVTTSDPTQQPSTPPFAMPHAATSDPTQHLCVPPGDMLDDA